MLSQFSGDGSKPVLKDLRNFQRDIYPVGRLDHDSEGLLLLTNDRTLNDRLLNPKNRHRRTYLVQVDGDITEGALRDLAQGLTITVEGKSHRTAPGAVKKLETPPHVPEREPPVRFRKSIPTSWIELTLTEGKNRQVRKMTAAAGFPTLRLIRKSIEKLELGNMRPGEVIEIGQGALFSLLFGS